MAASKGKIMCGVGGGLFVVAAGVLGYLLFDAYSTRTEMEEDLENQMGTFKRYYEAPVFPSKKSIDGVVSNTADFASWREAASMFVARGDKAFPKDETPAAFKQRLSRTVRRLAALPGGADGHLAAHGFMFGFDKYLDPERGILPEAAAVPRLAAQLDSVARITALFAKAEVLEIKEVKCIEPAAEEEAEPDRRANAKKRRPAKKGEEEGPKMTALDYAFSFTVRPEAFVKVLNDITANQRFMVVKSFAFKETADMIVNRIADVEAAQAKKNAPSSGRRRRGRLALIEETQEEAPKKADRLVVDPELDAPVQVDMIVTVYDFGRAEIAAAGAGEGDKAAKGAEEKKETK
jgi:hypothetical protein